jgi:hypothetical protein
VAAVSMLDSSGGRSSSIEEEGAPHLVTSSCSPILLAFRYALLLFFQHISLG